MAEGWIDERDKAILDTIYHCESCNMVLEPGDTDIERHRKDLPNHKLRKVLIAAAATAETLSPTATPSIVPS